MKRLDKLTLLVVFAKLIFANIGAFASNEGVVISDSSSFLRISLMIAEPSNQHPQSAFGHAFLRMECPSAQLDYCYSMESGDYEGFLDICTGNYPNRLVAIPTAEYIRIFNKEGRTVTGYPLALQLEEGQRLWKILDDTSAQGISPYHDFFYHGCSREIIRLLGYSLNGKIVYGPNAQKYGNTIFILGNQALPDNSWMHLPPSFLSSVDGTDHELLDEDKTMIPIIIPELLADAHIVDEQGMNRPILLNVSADIFAPAQHYPENNSWPPYVWFCVMLVLTIVISCLHVYMHYSWLNTVILVYDAFLFLVYQFLWIIPFVVGILSTLPTTSGWNWNYLIYNPVPLFVYLVNIRKNLSTSTWTCTYSLYSAIMLAYMMVMYIIGGHLILEQYLIATTFAIRCLFKSAEYRKRTFN